MTVQQRFELVDLALIDSALGKEHDVDAVGCSTHGDEHPARVAR